MHYCCAHTRDSKCSQDDLYSVMDESKMLQYSQDPWRLSLGQVHCTCQSSPPSLWQFFYLVTDKYMDGTLRELQKWAYEIHSSFLVPGAPLRIPLEEKQFIVTDIDR